MGRTHQCISINKVGTIVIENDRYELNAYSKLLYIAVPCTFLLLSTTGYIGVGFGKYGEGVEPSNE